MKSRSRNIALFAAAAAGVASLAGAAVASGNLDVPFGVDPPASHFTGTHTTMTYALTTYDRPVRLRPDRGCDPASMCVGAAATGPVKRFDNVKLTCHGGVADIRWEIGDLESTVPQTGIRLTLTLDGHPLSTLIKGGFNGTYDDGPADIEAVTHCAKGAHEVYMFVDNLDGEWGVPYATPQSRVVRGFVVSETW